MRNEQEGEQVFHGVRTSPEPEQETAEARITELNTEESAHQVKTKPYIDYSLILVIFFLMAFGLLMIYSTSYYTAQIKLDDSIYYFRRQLMMNGLGIVAALAVVIFNYHIFANKVIVFLAWGASVVVMFLVNFTSFGIEFNGRKRWFGIGGHSLFQPAELVKIALIIVIAAILAKAKYSIDEWKKTAVLFGIIAVPTLFVIDNNLSSGLIILGIAFVMLFVSSTKKQRFLLFIAAAVALVLIAYFTGEVLVDAGILKKYQLSRILVWKDPTAYSQEGGWQVLQGLYAIGSGGIFGKGLGASTQKLGFVPEAQNDMIFSIICEELGIFGAVCLILMYVFLIYRMVRIAQNAPDRFGFLLVVGVIAHISLQVILNIAVVTNMIPNTGVSLPLVSYGGSSAIFTLAEFGLVFSVARKIRVEV